jgi:ribosomal protein L11 methyltransferase
MKPVVKPLWHLSVATSLEAEDAVAELAGSLLGCPAAAYYHLELRRSLVSVYREQPVPARLTARLAAGLQQIKRCGLDVGPARITVTRVKREDWAESWKRHFPPFSVGTSLLVKPSWSRRRPAKNQAVVILDPGLSFGTGRHPTTAFCLAEVVRQRQALPPPSFLDIGTGSGILAITAVKLGYQPVEAFDFDPAAVRVARDNAQANAVSGRLKIWRSDAVKLPLKPARRFDLVCANLISNLLIAERRRIAAQVKPGGTLVLAGILRGEFPSVAKAFAGLGWNFVRGKTDREWRSGAFRFDSPPH